MREDEVIFGVFLEGWELGWSGKRWQLGMLAWCLRRIWMHREAECNEMLESCLRKCMPFPSIRAQITPVKYKNREGT